MREYKFPKRFTVAWWCSLLVVGSVLIGCICVSWVAFSDGVLPTRDWQTEALGIAFLFGVLVALATPFWILSEVDPLRLKGRKLAKIGWCIWSPIITGAFGYFAAFTAVPMVSLWFVSEEVRAEYRVKLGQTARKGCPDAVELSGLPLGFETVCNVPDSMRERLHIGDTVVVTGRGNGLVMLPTMMRVVVYEPTEDVLRLQQGKYRFPGTIGMGDAGSK